jgi:hypothetical protein
MVQGFSLGGWRDNAEKHRLEWDPSLLDQNIFMILGQYRRLADVKYVGEPYEIEPSIYAQDYKEAEKE